MICAFKTSAYFINSHHVCIIFVKMITSSELFEAVVIDLTNETDDENTNDYYDDHKPFMNRKQERKKKYNRRRHNVKKSKGRRFQPNEVLKLEGEVIDLTNETDSENTNDNHDDNKALMNCKQEQKREYNRRRHHVKKSKCRRFQPNEVVKLMVSGIGISRKGSTMEQMCKATFVNIGVYLRKIFKRTNISTLKFIDVGHGHGCGLIDLAYVFGITAVGLEYDDVMYEGSVIHLKRYVKFKMNPKSIHLPYFPLKGNGLDVCSLGGAQVLYSWCNGAGPDLMENLYHSFVNDLTCIVLITSSRYHDSLLKQDNIRKYCQFQGHFCNGTFMLYIYVKKSKTRYSPKSEYNDVIASKIRKSFNLAAQFKQMQKEKKSKEFVISLINWACN